MHIHELVCSSSFLHAATIHSCLFLCVDAQFSLWTAGFARDGVGVLACIALNGFHATSQYQWLQNDHEIEEETYAILYTTSCGEYKCRVKVDEDIHEGNVFSVTGMLTTLKVVGIMNLSLYVCN